jgi:anti-anti-sigma factor
MSFYSEKIDDAVIEVVDIDRATFREAEEFKKLLNRDIESGFSKIIIDLSNCKFIDSTFLSTIVTTFKRVNKISGTLKLAGVRDEAEALLELTGTVKIFEIYPTKDEALKSFSVHKSSKAS